MRRFKALSRMSSSPTEKENFLFVMPTSPFQSAVAHELFSDILQDLRRCVVLYSFQSAVAHELFSDCEACGETSPRPLVFQSAVAHELFSDSTQFSQRSS